MAASHAIRNITEFEAAVKALPSLEYTEKKLYRGQRDAWPLLPNLFRTYKDKVELIHTKEQLSLQKLKTKIPQHTPMRPSNDWDWLSFGQHYGLPTRMLDWSTNPFVALFFAVEKAGSSPVIQIYHAQKSQIADATLKKQPLAGIDKTWIMSPTIHSVRLRLQDGWHTVHRLHPRKSGGRMVIPLADMKWHEGRLQTIKIDPTCSEAIRRELARTKGLNRQTIYGDFEIVCGEICKECFAVNS